MSLLHTCKTKTYEETRLLNINDRNQIEVTKQAVQHVQVEEAYRKLLEKESTVQYDIPPYEMVLPLKRNAFGLYMVPVQMYQKTYWFILDTGAQVSGIRSHVLDTLPIPKLSGKLPVGSVGGLNKDMDGYLVEELRIADVCVHHLPVISLKKEEFSMHLGSFDLFTFDGILGWDILSNLDFEIDDVAKQFKILHNRFRFVYENLLPAAFPLLFVKDQSQRLLTMGLDTGARNGWMSEERALAYGYPISNSQQMLGYGVHGMEKMDVKLIDQCDFYLYRAHIKLKNMHTGRTNIFPNLTIDGILGNEIFRNRRIRFVNSKHMILLA